MTSFTNPEIEYTTSSISCSCPDFYYRSNAARGYEPGYACKHIRLARRIEQGRPRNVDEARAQRIARRQAERRAAYATMYDPCQVA